MKQVIYYKRKIIDIILNKVYKILYKLPVEIPIPEWELERRRRRIKRMADEVRLQRMGYYQDLKRRHLI